MAYLLIFSNPVTKPPANSRLPTQFKARQIPQFSHIKRHPLKLQSRAQHHHRNTQPCTDFNRLAASKSRANAHFFKRREPNPSHKLRLPTRFKTRQIPQFSRIKCRPLKLQSRPHIINKNHSRAPISTASPHPKIRANTHFFKRKEPNLTRKFLPTYTIQNTAIFLSSTHKALPFQAPKSSPYNQ